MAVLFEQYGIGNGATLAVPSASYAVTDPAAISINGVGATGLRVIVNISAASGGGGVTVSINGVDKVGGTFLMLASALLVAPQVARLHIDPRIASVANTFAQLPCTSMFSVTCVGSGVRTTLTYSVTAELTV